MATRQLVASGSKLVGSVTSLWQANLARSICSSSINFAPVNSKDGKVTHPELLNANVLNTQYAVRGELYLRATELEKQGKEIIYTNVGNPHQLKQVPVTFNRQVMALVAAPFLLDDPKMTAMFPKDVVERARVIHGYLRGGVGAYSDSRGAAGIRQECADFCTKRDGHVADPENFFLTDGASVAVRLALNTLIRNSDDCILVPIPQYPLYSASIALYGGTLVPYHLKESENWSMSIEELKKAHASATSQGKVVRGMVFINPGNPTGQCLSQSNLQDIVRFAREHQVVLMADEVYQENIYQDERPFISMKKTLLDMGEPYAKEVELMSFHTVSKGALGECGLRGGYVECTNIHPGCIEQMYKMVSINLAPNTFGQVGLALMCNPPAEGSESHAQWKAEKQAIIDSLRRRAHMMTDGFNALEDVTCNFTEGAMYSFPQLRLPQKFLDEAKAKGKAPDVLYCLQLLEATGISTVPGSGFGQEPGTFHLRTTILPQEDKMRQVVELLKVFHADFMKKYKHS